MDAHAISLRHAMVAGCARGSSEGNCDLPENAGAGGSANHPTENDQLARSGPADKIAVEFHRVALNSTEFSDEQPTL